MYREPAEIPALYQCPHPSSDMAELGIMSGRHLQPLLISQGKKSLRIRVIERKGLLYVDMASSLQTRHRQLVMALRRSGEVNDIRSDLRQQLVEVRKTSRDPESLSQLPRHERFGVADCHDVTIGYSPDLMGVRIGNLAAAHDGHSKHRASSPGSRRKTCVILRPSAPSEPIQDVT